MNDNPKTAPKDMFSEWMQDPELVSQFEREWLASEIILQIEQKMEEQKVSRKKLAELLNCKPPNVTQILRKGSNLTLATIVDIALALGHRFLPPKMVPLTSRPPWQNEELRLVSCKTAPWSPTAAANGNVGSAVSPSAWEFQAPGEPAEPHAGELNHDFMQTRAEA